MISAVWGVTTISSTYKIRFVYCKPSKLFELGSNDGSQVTALLDFFLIPISLKSLKFAYSRYLRLLKLNLNNFLQIIVFWDFFSIPMSLELLAFYLHKS